MAWPSAVARLSKVTCIGVFAGLKAKRKYVAASLRYIVLRAAGGRAVGRGEAVEGHVHRRVRRAEREEEVRRVLVAVHRLEDDVSLDGDGGALHLGLVGHADAAELVLVA